MEGTKAEIEDKVSKILKLIKNKDKGKRDGLPKDSKKDAELVKLVHDFHKQYQSLYALYDHLKGESEKKAHGREGKESYSSSSSTSDSEYYSSEDIESNNINLKNEHQKATNSSQEELKSESSDVADLKHKLASTIQEKEALNSEYMAALSKIQEGQIVNMNLMNEADERKREFSALLKKHDFHGSRASARIKELEDQLTGLKVELNSLHNQKKDLEARIESKAAEGKQLGEKNKGLHAHVLELELISKEKGHEISNLLKKLNENENNLTCKFEDLHAQISNLQVEVECLRAQKGDLEGSMACKKSEAMTQVEGLTNQVNIFQRELDSLHSQKTELELQLERKTKEISENLIQISNLHLEVNSLQAQKGELEGSMVCNRDEASDQVKGLMDQVNILQQELDSLCNQKTELELQLGNKKEETSESLIQIGTLKEKLARKNVVEQRMLEQKEGLLAQVKDLEFEMDSLRNQKKELEEQIRSKTHETDQLKEENEGLLLRLFELEGILTGRGDGLSTLQKMYEGNEIDASTQITALKAQVDNLQQELAYLQDQKSQLESQNERLKHESSQSQNKMEAENVMLTSKIADLETNRKQLEDTINKFAEDQKQIKRLSLGSRVNLQGAERKMEELAEDFRKKSEYNIRLLYQRILVAEQIHNENKETYRRTKETLQQENKLLGEKVATYETELKKLRDTLEPGNNALAGLDLVVRKLEDNGEFLNRISKISNELVSTKNWVTGANNKIKQLKHNVDCLVAQLDDKEEQEVLLREKVWKLEAKLGKEGGEKLNLMKAVSQLEKKVGEMGKKINEKDERLLELGEEKREAIRQLCILIDYHCNRFNHLKYLISKMNVRSRQKS